MRFRTTTDLPGLAALAALVLLVTGAALTAGTSAPAPAAPGAAALRAAIDPETGVPVTGPEAMRLSGAADKDADLARMLDRSDEGLVEVRHPDGRVSVRLDGRFMSASVARLAPDGSVETLCAESRAEARAFLDGADADSPDAPEVK